MNQSNKAGLIGVLIVLVLFFLIGQTAEAAQAMRCKGALINNGATVYKIMKNCGSPLLERTTVGIQGNTTTRLYYESYGMTYVITLKNDIVTGITANREGA